MVSFNVSDVTYLEPDTVSANNYCCILTGLWFCMFKATAACRHLCNLSSALTEEAFLMYSLTEKHLMIYLNERQ